MAIGTGLAILGGGIASSLIGSKSAKGAANAQQAGNNAAIAEQRRQFDLIQQMTAPQREFGNNATNALSALLGFGGDYDADLSKLPGNEVIVDDMMRRIKQSSPTTGGNVLTALSDRVSGYQSNELFNRLFQAAGMGGPANNTAANAGMNSGNAISGLMQSSGMANASGIMGQGNSINGGLQNILQYYAMQNMLGGKPMGGVASGNPAFGRNALSGMFG